MGRVYKPEYTVTLKDGTTERRKTAWYHVEYTDARGKTRHRKASPTHDLAKEILRKLEEEAGQERHGLPTGNSWDLALEDLKTRYLSFQASRVVPEYLHRVDCRLKDLFAHAQAVRVRDLTPEKVEAFLAFLGAKTPSPAPHTLNLYLQAPKGLLSWAVEMRLIPHNPLACLKPRPQEGKRRNRRILGEEQLPLLLDAARWGPLVREALSRCRIILSEDFQEKVAVLQETRKRLERGEIILSEELIAQATDRGQRNALIYRMLAFTGLRVGELSAMTWGDVDLEEGTVTARAETTKSGHQAIQDLPPGLVAALKTWRAKRDFSGADPVLTVPGGLLKTFNGDLELAGIEKKDASGRTLDLHALRHLYGTMLVRSGVDLRTVQAMMRHASLSMTGVYLHHDRERLRRAARALPEIGLEPDATKRQPAQVQAVALREGTTGQEVASDGPLPTRFQQDGKGYFAKGYADKGLALVGADNASVALYQVSYAPTVEVGIILLPPAPRQQAGPPEPLAEERDVVQRQRVQDRRIGRIRQVGLEERVQAERGVQDRLQGAPGVVPQAPVERPPRGVPGVARPGKVRELPAHGAVGAGVQGSPQSLGHRLAPGQAQDADRLPEAQGRAEPLARPVRRGRVAQAGVGGPLGIAPLREAPGGEGRRAGLAGPEVPDRELVEGGVRPRTRVVVLHVLVLRVAAPQGDAMGTQQVVRRDVAGGGHGVARVLAVDVAQALVPGREAGVQEQGPRVAFQGGREVPEHRHEVPAVGRVPAHPRLEAVLRAAVPRAVAGLVPDLELAEEGRVRRPAVVVPQVEELVRAGPPRVRGGDVRPFQAGVPS